MNQTITLNLPLLLMSLIPLVLGMLCGIYLTWRFYLSCLSKQAMHETAQAIAQQMLQQTQRFKHDVFTHQNSIDQIEHGISEIQQGQDLSLNKAVDLLAQMSDANQSLRKKLADAEKSLQEQADQLHATISEARTDALTKLLNRRAFNEQLNKLLATWERHQQTFALILFDIDHFKSINDRYGHPVGDQVIQHIANVMVAATRETDFVARFGGEEIAVLLPKESVAKAQLLAERILSDLRDNPILIEDLSLNITASCGLVSVEDLLQADQVVEEADKALYKAKNAGRNQGCICDGHTFHFFGTVQDGLVKPEPISDQSVKNSFDEVCSDLRSRLEEVIQ